jgi:hypothetical protein
VDKPVIGIRQADGSFYKIMDEAQAGRKRLVLSAARTDQHGVRIDLYRSGDGTLDLADSLGSISLDDSEGLGFQDIEFHVDIDAQAQLSASAALPGHSPQTLSVDLTPFRGPRSDAEILGDEALAGSDLDILDDSFAAETLDLPEVEVPGEEPRRSDADILGDDDLAMADLDSLDDFESEPASGTEAADPAGAPDSFDLGDLDAGFAASEEPSKPRPAPEEDWEKISLDDMEPMEFMDTGDEISKPSARVAPPPERPEFASQDEFSMDDEEALVLGDLNSDLSDLPDLDDFEPGPKTKNGASSQDDFDSDFLPPPALTETPIWEAEPAGPKGKGKVPKTPKAAKPAKAPRSDAVQESGGLDKTALFLSLAALSLLVMLILVLLFLNMIKAPVPPVIQPEVMGWSQTAAMASSRSPQPSAVDLGGAKPATFEANTVLEVPEGLRQARISMKLEPGETVADAGRRFGSPARTQGNQLFW